MSCVDVRERVADSPARARSLFTVRAAISSARSSLAPRSSWLSLTCSYCRARFVPFLTPRGGTFSLQERWIRTRYPQLAAANDADQRSLECCHSALSSVRSDTPHRAASSRHGSRVRSQKLSGYCERGVTPSDSNARTSRIG